MIRGCWEHKAEKVEEAKGMVMHSGKMQRLQTLIEEPNPSTKESESPQQQTRTTTTITANNSDTDTTERREQRQTTPTSSRRRRTIKTIATAEAPIEGAKNDARGELVTPKEKIDEDARIQRSEKKDICDKKDKDKK